MYNCIQNYTLVIQTDHQKGNNTPRHSQNSPQQKPSSSYFKFFKCALFLAILFPNKHTNNKKQEKSGTKIFNLRESILKSAVLPFSPSLFLSNTLLLVLL
uniref:Uncharacterized protein n=1 Tax=Cacopsylla melanoneura TaxID=428564 RepID=A0A8D9FGS4_9HEMI